MNENLNKITRTQNGLYLFGIITGIISIFVSKIKVSAGLGDGQYMGFQDGAAIYQYNVQKRYFFSSGMREFLVFFGIVLIALCLVLLAKNVLTSKK